MTIKTTLYAVMAASLLLGTGCKKSDSEATTGTPEAGATAIGVTPTTTAPQAGVAVATYPDTISQSGTKQLLQPFTVYQAADATSPIIARVSTGQWINLKGLRGNWMLIEWPSGVGQMSPGWIEVKPGDSRLSQSPPGDAGAPGDAGTPTSTVVDAGTPVDAGKTDAGTPVDAGTAGDGGKPVRGGIVLKPRH